MSEIDLGRLRAVASKAGVVTSAASAVREVWALDVPAEVSHHFDTFDPPTVLALLDRLERAEAAVERVRALADDWARATCACGGVSACLPCQYADRIAVLAGSLTVDFTERMRACPSSSCLMATGSTASGELPGDAPNVAATPTRPARAGGNPVTGCTCRPTRTPAPPDKDDRGPQGQQDATRRQEGAR